MTPADIVRVRDLLSAAFWKKTQQKIIDGYVEDFFAEAYCAGVPFSEEKDGVETFGDPLTRLDVFMDRDPSNPHSARADLLAILALGHDVVEKARAALAELDATT